MKRFVVIIILLSIFFEATAQKKVIDTIWFRVPTVSILDEGLLDALDSIILAYTQDLSSKKLVWYISFLDEETDSNSGDKVDLIMDPSNFIIPTMKKSDGFFSYKENLFFIEKRNEKGKRLGHIFSYSNNTKPFYYITINWRLLWSSDLDKSTKAQLCCKYASIEDYPSILLTRDSYGLWTWLISDI